jgi:N-acetylglucosaminyldiphosphoundecaprenol N-acetyl-beta-D-mannosaminyltransferase
MPDSEMNNPAGSRDTKILGINIDNITMDEAISAIFDWLNGNRPKQVVFVNADCANIAQKNDNYLKVLNGADLRLADGIGLRIAAKVMGKEIVQNVNGTDMFPLLCQKLSDAAKRVYLLGARPEAVAGVALWIAQNFPEVQVCGYHHGYFGPEEAESLITSIRKADPDLLLVAFGAPKQELWIHEYLERTGAKVAIGVGGLFDFYSGRIPRAPSWMREIGMEWVYRLIQEPRRLWRRYLIGNGLFLFRVVAERFTGNQDV